MKKYLVATLFVFCVGCNMSENKEARIQKLEAEIEQVSSDLEELQKRVQSLETPASAKEG